MLYRVLRLVPLGLLALVLLALLLASSCALYRQTIRTERAVEVSVQRITAAATNAVAAHEVRAAETHSVLIEILRDVAIGAGLVVAYYAEEIKRRWKNSRQKGEKDE